MPARPDLAALTLDNVFDELATAPPSEPTAEHPTDPAPAPQFCAGCGGTGDTRGVVCLTCRGSGRRPESLDAQLGIYRKLAVALAQKIAARFLRRPPSSWAVEAEAATRQQVASFELAARDSLATIRALQPQERTDLMWWRLLVAARSAILTAYLAGSEPREEDQEDATNAAVALDGRGVDVYRSEDQ